MKSTLKIINNISILFIIVVMSFSIFGCNSSNNNGAEDPVKKKAELGGPVPPAEQAKAQAAQNAARDAFMKKHGINAQPPPSQQ